MSEHATTDYQLLDTEKPDTAQPRSWCARTFSAMGPGSLRGSIMTLSSGAIGAGVLSLPYAISKCGLVLGLLLIVVAVATYSLLYRVLAKAVAISGEGNFAALVRHFYGSKMQRLAEFGIVVMQFGALCTYQVLIVKFLMDIVEACGLELEALWFYLFNLILTAIVSVLSIPKNFSSLRYLASGCILSLAYIAAVVVVQTPSYIASQDIAAHIRYVRFEVGTIHAFSILMFSVCSVLALCLTCKELERPSYHRATRVIDRSLLLTLVFYVLLGLAGYFSYIDKVPELVTDREKGSGETDWPMVVAKGCFAVSLVANFLISLHPLRLTTAECVMGIGKELTDTVYYVINYFLIFAAGAVATLLPRVIDYFTFLGGFAVVLCAVVLPTLVYLQIETNLFRKVAFATWSFIVTAVGFASAVLTILGIT